MNFCFVLEGMKYWTKAKPIQTNERRHHSNNGKAINIELTAYALLTLALNNERDEGLQVLKWLISQRNPNGGFSSTQVMIRLYNPVQINGIQ